MQVIQVSKDVWTDIWDLRNWTSPECLHNMVSLQDMILPFRDAFAHSLPHSVRPCGCLCWSVLPFDSDESQWRSLYKGVLPLHTEDPGGSVAHSGVQGVREVGVSNGAAPHIVAAFQPHALWSPGTEVGGWVPGPG